ncbi:hypothetical protein BN1723_000748, partial [Verticillium longisporum]
MHHHHLALAVACAAGAHVAHAQFGTGISPLLFPLLENVDSNDLFPVDTCGDGFQLEEATIDDMQRAMEAGALTSHQLVLCYLQRTYQTQEYTKSLLQFNPDAFAIAAERDAERAAGKVRGPLHGIPFTVKDNIATKDSLETTAGSYALQGSIVPRDAHVVARLREAGAVLQEQRRRGPRGKGPSLGLRQAWRTRPDKRQRQDGGKDVM